MIRFAPRHESVIVVTLTGNLGGVAASLAAHIPPSFDEHDHPEAGTYRWDFRRLQGPDVTLRPDGKVQIFAKYYGDIETHKPLFGCHLGSSPGVYEPGKPWVYIDFTVALRPAITTGSDGGWYLTGAEPEVRVELGAGSDTHCSLFGIDVSDQLRRLLSGDAVKNAVVNALNTAKFPVPVPELWRSLSGPFAIALPALSSLLCIYPNPVDLTIGPLTGSMTDARAIVALRAFPSASVQQGGQCPPATVSAPQVSNNPVLDGPFVLDVPIAMSYSEITRILEGLLVGTEFGKPPYSMRIRSLSVSTNNGRLVLAAETTGFLNGALAFSASPALEETGIRVVFPDLDVTDETRMALNNSVPGLGDALSVFFSVNLRPKAVLDLRTHLEQARAAISGAHQVSGVALSITVDEFRPTAIASQSTCLVLNVAARGKAAAIVPLRP